MFVSLQSDDAEHTGLPSKGSVPKSNDMQSGFRLQNVSHSS